MNVVFMFGKSVRLLSLIHLLLVCSGCFWSDRITLNQDNLNLIKDGMSVDQVIKILGQPDTIKYGKTKDLFTECWTYRYVKIDSNSAAKLGSYPLKTRNLHVWFDGTQTIRDFGMKIESGHFVLPPIVSG
jgi:outer membrane protein assembly factor BamE (lipoprotein component of BamABCDE complex)